MVFFFHHQFLGLFEIFESNQFARVPRLLEVLKTFIIIIIFFALATCFDSFDKNLTSKKSYTYLVQNCYNEMHLNVNT